MHKRIRTLQLVEDSNQFTVAELGDQPWATPYTVGGSEIKVGDEVVGIKRVDRIPAKAELTLPARQADNLVELGCAEFVEAAAADDTQ